MVTGHASSATAYDAALTSGHEAAAACRRSIGAAAEAACQAQEGPVPEVWDRQVPALPWGLLGTTHPVGEAH